MKDIPVILASASPRRKELLEQIGLDPIIIKSDIEEVTACTKPEEVVVELAGLKARGVAASLEEDGLVIGADTVVAIDHQIFGKPESKSHAYEMIHALSGREHQVYTGVSIICKCGEEVKEICFFETTRVCLFPMSKEEIDGYIATGDPMDKAGAYGIQGAFAAFIEKIDGDYNNVVGLPVARVYQELKQLER